MKRTVHLFDFYTRIVIVINHEVPSAHREYPKVYITTKSPSRLLLHKLLILLRVSLKKVIQWSQDSIESFSIESK